MYDGLYVYMCAIHNINMFAITRARDVGVELVDFGGTSSHTRVYGGWQMFIIYPTSTLYMYIIKHNCCAMALEMNVLDSHTHTRIRAHAHGLQQLPVSHAYMRYRSPVRIDRKAISTE